VFGWKLRSIVSDGAVELWWRVQPNGCWMYFFGNRWLCNHRVGGVFWHRYNLYSNTSHIGRMFVTRCRNV
jgi:hypothetical protein